jgi:Transposase and inactivated derivatives
LREEFQASECRVCGLMRVPRSSCRYGSRRDDDWLRERLLALAQEHPRFGYRRLHVLLRREEVKVNHKKVQRVYGELGLVVKRNRRKRLHREPRPRPVLTAPGQEWSVDFANDVVASGRRIRILSAVDSFTRQCWTLEVDTSFPSRRVTRVLDRAITLHGKPQAIRSDNGPELTSRHFLAWAIENKIDLVHIQPGRPTENAYVESFHGKFRDECLNTSWFWNLFDARRKISMWKTEYNSRRPHSSLGYRTPDEFAQQRRLASPSCSLDRAAGQPPQGNPNGLRFAPALTRLPCCPEEIHQEGEAKKEIRL